jgi:hypothetical protein
VSDQAAPRPRTIAARALLTRAPGDRGSMRGVAMSEFAKLLVRIEEEASAPYRAELEWALSQLEKTPGADAGHIAQIRDLLAQG